MTDELDEAIEYAGADAYNDKARMLSTTELLAAIRALRVSADPSQPEKVPAYLQMSEEARQRISAEDIRAIPQKIWPTSFFGMQILENKHLPKNWIVVFNRYNKPIGLYRMDETEN